jgi:cytochrome c oxidase subunit 2
MPAPVRRTLLAFSLSAGTALACSGAAAARDNGGFTPVSPASPNAERIVDIYWLLVVVAGLVFLAVTIPLLVFVVRYRSAGRDRSVEGPQIRGNTNLELGWTVAAALILVVIAAFVFYKLPGIQNPDAAAADEQRIQVEGRQFYWRYLYPEGAVSIDTLRVPADRTVRLVITAPDEDVNHSFWIPALGGKMDAIPGIVNELWFHASEPGVYDGQCAEFCGIQHAQMRAAVEVLTQAEYESWVEERAASADGLGEEQWNGICAKCHRLGDEPQLIGPSLSAAVLADAETVEEIVRNGQGAMPAVGRGWTDEEMDALLAYLEELSQEVESGG